MENLPWVSHPDMIITHISELIILTEKYRDNANNISMEAKN